MNKFKGGWTIAGLTIAMLGMTAGSAAWGAVPVAVINAGFEDPVYVDGDWDSFIPGWEWFNGGDIGVWNVEATDYPLEAPEGSNVAWVWNEGAGTGASQVLSGATGRLELDAVYSMTFYVGYAIGYTNPGYQVQLLAGGTVLAQDDNSVTLTQGVFSTSTVNYTYDGAHSALVGQPLEIRLLSKGLGEENEFDAIAMNATYAHPVADANGPHIAADFVGYDSVSFDGSASFATEGSSIASYEWDLNNDGTYGDVTGATPSAISYTDLTTTWGMTPGVNTVGLRVTDVNGAAGASTHTTTVKVFPIGQPLTTTITGTAGGADSWNDATNWDAGIPSGPLSAAVGAGVTAQVQNAATPTYLGTLTLESNAVLKIVETGSDNALGTGIIMNEGSEIHVNGTFDPDFPAIELVGNGTFRTIFGASDWQISNYNGEISGPGTLTFVGFNGHHYRLKTANSFEGGFIADAIDRYDIHLDAAGAVPGDMSVNQRGDQITPNRSARINFEVADAMADDATLFLNGPVGGGGFAGDGIDWVMINHAGDETIAGLMLYGIALADGTYDNTEIWLGGIGTLTVTAPDPALPGDANGNGFVDDTDLAILLGNWESEALVISTWALGNFTEVSLGDTDVDDSDLAVLLGNWTGPPPPGGAAVPEPATLALLGLGGLSVLRRRRSCLRP